MTIREAKDIIDRYELKSVMTPDEEFLLTEAFNYIIEETKDTRYMVRLGGRWYRDIDEFFKKAEIDGERIPVLYSEISAVKAEAPAASCGR